MQSQDLFSWFYQWMVLHITTRSSNEEFHLSLAVHVLMQLLLELSGYRVELLVESGEDTAMFVAFD
ncbi:hypothetical protein YC2023_113413 [Brassica napus]